MKKLRAVLIILVSVGLIGFVGWRNLPVSGAIQRLEIESEKIIEAKRHSGVLINLLDGETVRTEFSAEADLLSALQNSEPTTLAKGDLNSDGTPDLISGFANKNGGFLTIHRGNELSIFPAGRDARGEKISPFLADASLISITEKPDFSEVGDFNNDTSLDVVTAQNGGTKLNYFKGNGRGEFAEVEKIEVGGNITALVAGDLNRDDGTEDLAVAIGAKVLIYEGWQGALNNPKIEAFDLPKSAGILQTVSLDRDAFGDLAIAAENELLVIRGRDRKLTRGENIEVPEAVINRHEFDSKIMAMTAGRFTETSTEIALLTENGVMFRVTDSAVHTLAVESLGATGNFTAEAVTLNKARVSASGSTDDLILLDRENRQIQIFGKGELLATFDGEAIATLPMRLNKDGLDDLVFLSKNQIAPAVAMTAPQAVFTVNSVGLEFDATPGNGVCETATGNGECTLQAAIGETNALAGADEIRFNLPGSAPFSIALDLQFLRTLTQTVTIDATTQPGFSGAPIVEINGAAATINPRALQFGSTAGSSVMRGFVINRFSGNGIVLDSGSSGILIEGNYIGTNIAGTAASPNGTAANIDSGGGINANGSSHTIGGTTAAARNVISGNNHNGIRLGDIASVSGTVIRGNFIGTDKNGTTDLGNAGDGIRSGNIGGASVTIGGTAAGAGNVISGNGRSGIQFTSNTGIFLNLVIEGNFIGTDLNGNLDLGNDNRGVLLNGYKNARIGGTSNASRNIISGNGKDGIELNFSQGVNVQGNFIGVKSDSTTPLTNDRHAVFLTNQTEATTIGGGTPVIGQCNAPCNTVIAGVNGKGVSMRSDNPPSLSENQLGGSPQNQFNLLINILMQKIFAKAYAPSSMNDLNDDGPTPNDTGDGDTGINNLQNHAIPDECLFSFNASNNLVNFQCTGNLNSLFSTNFTIDFYLNVINGQTATANYVGSQSVTTNAQGNAPFTFNFTTPITNGASISAITRRSNGDTSEDSPPLQLGGTPCTYQVTPTSFNIPAAGSNGNSVTIETQAGCSWTASSNAAFITNVSPASGSGNGTVTFNVAANLGGIRTGNLTVAGQTVTVNQASNCTFSVSPTTVNLSGAEQFSSVNLTTQTGCEWTGASNTAFISAVTPSGVGSGIVNFAVTANNGAPRTGTFTVGGQIVTVNQTSCTLAINPSSITANARGGNALDVNFRTLITTESGCPWSVSAENGMTAQPNAGTSSQSIGFSVGQNNSAPRTLTATISNNIASVAFTVQQSGKNASLDFDSDNKTDIATYGSSSNFMELVPTNWKIINSSNGTPRNVQFGEDTDKLVPGDYNGDGTADFAVFRPSDRTWYIARPTGVPAQNFDAIPFGVSTDIPVPADYDGDGKTDIAVFRPSTGEWWIRRSSNGNVTVQRWGINGDKPVPGFYDNDGKADIAVWRPSDRTWYILNSSDGSFRFNQFGLSSDKPVPGDYDGDFLNDIAVFRPSTGEWFILQSSNNSLRGLNWGLATDKLTPADFDGDLKTDIAVWRPSTQTWFILQSTNGVPQITQQGQNGDIPVVSALMPE